MFDYRSNRENGDVCDSPQKPFPSDGTYTWMKGEKKSNFGGLIFGKREGNNVAYELRYDEGPGDKKWMEEKDNNYLSRLKKEEDLKQKEKQNKEDPIKKQEEELKKKEEEIKKDKDEFEKQKNEFEEKQKNGKEEKELKEKELKQKEEEIKKQMKELEDKLNNANLQQNNQSPIIALPTIKYSCLQLDTNKPLGKGGFGIVYKGTYNNDPVAVKELLALDVSSEKKFVEEATFMAQMSFCPRVIKIQGICVEPNHYSIVMELMPKGSLFDLLHNNQELPWKIRYQISMDITVGVEYLHEHNIKHRDLKSLNVLLDENLRAKITDFGLAKTKKTITSIKILTGAKKDDCVGTLPWMAPELFKMEEYTSASDVYSVGMVFWEIAARKVPWRKALDSQIIIDQVKNGNREKIPKKCPKSYAQLITNCWKERTQRPKMQEIRKTLEEKNNKNEIVNFAP
jgi:flagellar biosynthesis GTPase FlhF